MLANEYKNSSLKIFSLKGNEPLAREVADTVWFMADGGIQ
ncbi:MAG: ribose-phosphate pyrophosphokinase, partial [Staphylococcus simulans]|nr:ribose-phosphate pyrophosphokinase [Staphylococcus simulans]